MFMEIIVWNQSQCLHNWNRIQSHLLEIMACKIDARDNPIRPATIGLPTMGFFNLDYQMILIQNPSSLHVGSICLYKMLCLASSDNFKYVLELYNCCRHVIVLLLFISACQRFYPCHW